MDTKYISAEYLLEQLAQAKADVAALEHELVRRLGTKTTRNAKKQLDIAAGIASSTPKDIARKHGVSTWYVLRIAQRMDLRTKHEEQREASQRRKQYILDAVDDGRSCADVAREYGLSRSRVAQIYHQRRPQPDDYIGLPSDKG